MGKISDDILYPIKVTPVVGDTIIGTDSQDNDKTVQFPVESFSGEGGVSLENNRFLNFAIGYAATAAQVANRINSLNPTIEVLADQIPLFFAIKPSISTQIPSRLQIWALENLGKGTYGVGGTNVVSDTTPFVIENRPIDETFTPDEILNANVEDLGVIDTDILTSINANTYTIDAGTNWYFEGTVNGNRVLYGWQGGNGVYGLGGTTVVDSDLFLVVDDSKIESERPTGLEKITESGKSGWRLVDQNPSLYGNIGQGAVDMSTALTGNNKGARGDYSTSMGFENIASGFGSTVGGGNNVISGSFGTGFGNLNISNGYASLVTGYGNNENSSTGYAFVSGMGNILNNNAGFASGVALQQQSGVSTFIAGAANIPISGANNGTSLTQPMFIFGNGTHTVTGGTTWTAITRSNLMVGLRNGEVTLPSTTIAVIDGESTGKQLTTKEWVLSKISGLSGDGQLALLGAGYVIKGRDEDNYGTVGKDAVDFSFSDGASSVRGATGDDSLATGLNVIVSGNSALGFGINTTSSGDASISGGLNSIASGDYAVSLGKDTIASGDRSFAFGDNVIASGENSMAIGNNITAYSNMEIAIGLFSTSYTPSSTSGPTKSALDRLFVVGNGSGLGSESDALTILSNGRVGIGINNFETNLGTEVFTVGGNTSLLGGLVLSNLPTYDNDADAGLGGLSTNNVYKTTTGELRIKL